MPTSKAPRSIPKPFGSSPQRMRRCAARLALSSAPVLRSQIRHGHLETSRLPGQWSDDDYDVLENGVIISHIFKVPIAPAERPWMWASGHKAAHSYEPTRATAMTAFAKSWRRS